MSAKPSSGVGAVAIAVVAMLFAVVASSFSSTTAGALSFVALVAAAVGFVITCSLALRAR